MLILLSLLVAVVVFIVGNAVRVVRYARLPLPLRWELYPIPKGPRDRQAYGGSYFEDAEWWNRAPAGDRSGELKFIAKEVLLLDTVRENFRALWIWSLLLHWGLYLCIAALVMGVACLPVNSLKCVDLVVVIHGFGCTLGLVGSAGLLLVRLMHRRLRGYSSRLSIFDLLLLGSIFATGLLSFEQLALGVYFFAMFLRAFPATTFTLALPPAIAVHLGLVAFFLAYFPFTHMTHAYMKFFSWHGVRWDDTPAQRDPRVAGSLAASLQGRVSWAAPHIAGEGGSSWVGVVADAAGKGSEKRA